MRIHPLMEICIREIPSSQDFGVWRGPLSLESCVSYLLCDSNSNRFSWEDKMCYFKGKEVDIYKIIMLDTTL